MSAPRIREAIRQCFSETQSDSPEVQLKALHTLVSITKVSSQNRNLVAQTEGTIPALLALSKSSSDSIQILSLYVLFNLSLNPDLKQSLLYHLNSIIASLTSTESGRVASSLVCSLAMLDKNKAKFGVAGTIQLLVKAISGSGIPRELTLAVKEAAVEALIQVVGRSDGEDLAGTSLLFLGLLARFDEGLNALRKTDQIVSSMVQVFKGRCMLSKEGAAEIMLLLFDESEGCVRDALRLPDFSTLVADVSVRGSGRAREKAALLMKKIMEADLDSYVDGNSMFSEW
ncbi:hypothetical protein DVH24_021070 [Malus domestica]|uniref:Armadillo repeat-containing domain-containing protein n=1 Tax=Malus domestica TaxID=3750 RepID=A0A498JB92_MALDO|nr:hypothetical protein DVH24_021070 [Malus domestica]